MNAVHSMMIEPGKALRGELEVPGDKSMTHRALFFAALAQGESVIENPLDCADTQSTVKVLSELGVTIDCARKNVWTVRSPGLRGFTQPARDLDAGNSGTTARLLLGLLAAQKFASTVVGDDSLSRRPMDRVLFPLQRMGARFNSERGHLPVQVLPAPEEGLTALHYQSPVASAQVKSACLLAALYAHGTSSITEPSISRDHTERLLRQYMPITAGMVVNDELQRTKKGEPPYKVELSGPVEKLNTRHFLIPGDFSSAAFFLVGACLNPHSAIKIKNVGMNRTRAGLWDILLDMKASVRKEMEIEVDGELKADLFAEYHGLHAANVYGEIVPRAIDELPIWCVAACLVQPAGTLSVLSDAGELRVKETDRLGAVLENLRRLGVHLESKSDGMVIRSLNKHFVHPRHSKHGPGYLESFGDHRIAMAMAIAALRVQGTEPVEIRGAEAVRISYPGFEKDFKKLLHGESP